MAFSLNNEHFEMCVRKIHKYLPVLHDYTPKYNIAYNNSQLDFSNNIQ